MSIERYLRLIAGFFVMLSVALGYWVNPELVSVHRLRGPEPVPVGIHQLVPDDHDSCEKTPPGRNGASKMNRRNMTELLPVLGIFAGWFIAASLGPTSPGCSDLNGSAAAASSLDAIRKRPIQTFVRKSRPRVTSKPVPGISDFDLARDLLAAATRPSTSSCTPSAPAWRITPF